MDRQYAVIKGVAVITYYSTLKAAMSGLEKASEQYPGYNIHLYEYKGTGVTQNNPMFIYNDKEDEE